jgi:hypothetical protein
VNSGIPDSEASIVYESFESAIHIVREFGAGTLLAKLDLKDAFHHIPVAPSQWHLLGFHWKSQFYYAVVLIFGLRSAPYIFNLFAKALHWIISRHIPAALRHYLDDFLPIFMPGTPLHVAEATIDWCQGLGQQLGLTFQPEKTVRPCTHLEYLGLTIDTTAMEARLPADKLAYLHNILDAAIRSPALSLKQIQELVGFLQFSAQVIPHSRPFIRRLIDFSMTFKSPFSRRRTPAYARADLRWWHSFCNVWNGIRLIQPTLPTVHVYTDASGRKGIGGIFDQRWFSARVPRRLRVRDIQFKEIYAVLQAILRWGNLWEGHHVVFHVDNSAVVAAITKETTRARFTMTVVRNIAMLASFLQFSFSSSWLPSHMNALADSASRFQYSRLFTLAPSLDSQNCSTNPRLVGIKRMLTCPLPWHFSSGMVWPAALGAPTALASDLSLTSSPCGRTCSILIDHSSLPTSQRSLSGLHISASRNVSKPPLSSPILATSSPPHRHRPLVRSY